MQNKEQPMRFRMWLAYRWYDYLAEQEAYGIEVTTTPKEYFNKHKYWLKRQYKMEKKHG